MGLTLTLTLILTLIGGLDEYKVARVPLRSQIEYLGYELRTLLLQIYTALLQEKGAKDKDPEHAPSVNGTASSSMLDWLAQRSATEALGGDPAARGFLTTPFHTDELASDAADTLFAQ